jgi:hypothetical protein
MREREKYLPRKSIIFKNDRQNSFLFGLTINRVMISNINHVLPK